MVTGAFVNQLITGGPHIVGYRMGPQSSEGVQKRFKNVAEFYGLW